MLDLVSTFLHLLLMFGPEAADAVFKHEPKPEPEAVHKPEAATLPLVFEQD